MYETGDYGEDERCACGQRVEADERCDCGACPSCCLAKCHPDVRAGTSACGHCLGEDNHE